MRRRYNDWTPPPELLMFDGREFTKADDGKKPSMSSPGVGGVGARSANCPAISCRCRRF
jgi:hypothetical protein